MLPLALDAQIGTPYPRSAGFDTDRHTKRFTSKKVHVIEEINVLSGKMDELMKLLAAKSASSDPNDMPLSTLIENNNESLDVNFVGRNNFGNNAYRGNS